MAIGSPPSTGANPDGVYPPSFLGSEPEDPTVCVVTEEVVFVVLAGPHTVRRVGATGDRGTPAIVTVLVDGSVKGAAKQFIWPPWYGLS